MKNLLFCIFIVSLSLSAMNSMVNVEGLKTRLHEASVNKKSDLIIAGTFSFISVATGIQTIKHLYYGEFDYAFASTGLFVSSLWISKKMIESYYDNAQQEKDLRVGLAYAQQRASLKKEE